ncbi:MAG TPA: serine/threonine-protein kinase, partial [candidate division Zixibacteria bacterium]|nr:serine/threonine-protein kinase [candidate division Zixibacteria bacterium]
MIGQTVSHYKILKKIGAGGMGEVYLAEDMSLGRKVAIKFLSAEKAADPESRKRFIHEARAQAIVSHSNVATFHEVGEERDKVFIVMEYIEGQRLSELAKTEKLSLQEILNLAIQVGEGLQAAHEKGVMHRDINPTNILVSSKRVAKITDFGLAKWTEASTITRTGLQMGTDHYMSPEQVDGRKVDHRTDIFSFGVVLYELICACRPFDGTNRESLFYEILYTQPQPLARYCRGVPEGFQIIVDKALKKDKSFRYQSAADLLADLKGLQKELTEGGVEAAPKRKTLAVLPFENLGAAEDEYFADGITDEITTKLAKISALGVISRTSAIKYKKTEKTLRQIGAELGIDYVLEGTIRWHKSGTTNRVRINSQLIRVEDDTHLWAETYDRVLEQIFELQSDIADKVTRALQLA